MSIPTGVRFIASLRFAVNTHVISRYTLAHVEGLRLTMREGGVHTISLKNTSLHKIRCGSISADSMGRPFFLCVPNPIISR